MSVYVYRIVGKFGGRRVGEFERLAKKFGESIDRPKLLIVSTNLNGFSLVNHGWLTNTPPTKLSRYTV